MKQRYHLFRRENGIYYSFDTLTKKRQSLETADTEAAQRLAKAAGFRYAGFGITEAHRSCGNLQMLARDERDFCEAKQAWSQGKRGDRQPVE